MSDHTTAVWQDNRSTHYGHGRRRWVPKGVMLLAVLFIVGLLGACQTSPVHVAAIAVPSPAMAECAAPATEQLVTQACDATPRSSLPVLPSPGAAQIGEASLNPSVAERVARLSMF